MNKEWIDKIVMNLQQCNHALEYISYNYDEGKLINLPENIIESTCPSQTALIQVRDNNYLIDELRKMYL